MQCNRSQLAMILLLLDDILIYESAYTMLQRKKTEVNQPSYAYQVRKATRISDVSTSTLPFSETFKLT